MGGAGHATISDHTLVYRHTVLKGENSRAIAVRSPVTQGLIISNDCSSKGMRFASAKAGAKRTVSLADLVFSPCKRSLTSPSGCEPGVTSVGVDTLPPRMVGVSTRKDPKSVFYSGDAIDIAVLFTKPVIFVVSPDNGVNPFAVGRPYLDLNSGGEASFVGYFPNDNSTLLFRYLVASGETTDGKPLEVVKFETNGAVVTSANGLDIVANEEVLKAVKDANSGLSAAGLIVQRSSTARRLEVFGAVGGGRDVFSLHSVIYIILTFDDVVFQRPKDNNSAALDACRPTLRTNFGTLEFLPREEFNAIVQGNVAGRQQIVFRRSVEPEDGLYESIEIEKPYDTAVNATGCSPAATGMVVPVALSKIAGFYPLENQNNPFEAWVKFSNITVGLAPGRIGDVDILVTFSKPVDYQILLDPLNVQDAAKTREARLYGTPRIALNTLAYAYLLGYANPDIPGQLDPLRTPRAVFVMNMMIMNMICMT
eukprot:tig00021070_g17895.t1